MWITLKLKYKCIKWNVKNYTYIIINYKLFVPYTKNFDIGMIREKRVCDLPR